MLLAHVPRGFEFKGMKNSAALGDERQTAVLFYNAINPAPHRTVHVPARHRAMVERIYAHAGIDRAFAAPQFSALAELAPAAEIAVEVVAATGQAVISVNQPGRDLAKQVKNQLDDLRSGKVDVIYLDIGLCWPATPQLVADIEALGFSFCGVYPEKHADGDLLRLHCLNNQRIDPALIITASDMGQALLDYTLAEWKRVRS